MLQARGFGSWGQKLQLDDAHRCLSAGKGDFGEWGGQG